MLPLISLLLGLAIGYVVTRFWLASNKVPMQAFTDLTLEKELLDQQVTQQKAMSDDYKMAIEKLRLELQLSQANVAVLQKEKQLLNEQHEQNKQQLKEIQENLKLQFENLGHKIFTENTKQFKEESHTRLTEILLPLKNDLDGFKKKVDDSFGLQAREQHSLKNEIERIIKVNEQMTSQTTNLTKALKGDIKVQGNWGEVILERILEESGLRLGEDYILQGNEMGLKHAVSGQPLKPDVIVKLPEDRHIIIDAKVSLTDYERYCSDDEDTNRLLHLKAFLNSVKKHVNDLEQRRYQDAEQLKTPDFVLMFMPIEGAFSLAMQQDRELHHYAWGKKVVIVCPTTLFSTLRTIASIWNFERQQKNTLEIARQGATLYDKVVSFVEDMQKLGKQLNTTQSTYHDAMNKLADGKGNIVAKTQQLQKLGVKTAKNLAHVIPDALVDVEE